MTEQKKKRRRTVLFAYLSVAVHLYVLLIVSVSVDPELLRALFEGTELAANEPIEIMVSSLTSSEMPEEGLISQNPNAESAEESGDPQYNYFNDDLGMSDAESETLFPELSESSDSESSASAQEILISESGSESAPESQNADDAVFDSPDSGEGGASLDSNGESETTLLNDENEMTAGSSLLTSFYDPDYEMMIRMDSRGRTSLPTLPADYVEYFENMSEKISDTWQEFFPEIQYYLGILQSGDVEIRIQLTKDGDVREVEILDSFGYSVVDTALENSVIYAGNFGEVPEELPPGFYSEVSSEYSDDGDIALSLVYTFVLSARDSLSQD